MADKAQPKKHDQFKLQPSFFLSQLFSRSNPSTPSDFNQSWNKAQSLFPRKLRHKGCQENCSAKEGPFQRSVLSVQNTNSPYLWYKTKGTENSPRNHPLFTHPCLCPSRFPPPFQISHNSPVPHFHSSGTECGFPGPPSIQQRGSWESHGQSPQTSRQKGMGKWWWCTELGKRDTKVSTWRNNMDDIYWLGKLFCLCFYPFILDIFAVKSNKI